jgi:hypothetical protein
MPLSAPPDHAADRAPCDHAERMSVDAVETLHPVDASEPVSVELPADELRLLTWGLMQWEGPAYCPDSMAVAMGFQSSVSMLEEIQSIVASVKSSSSLTARDWTRALVSVELVFASDVVGTAGDWHAVTGWTDEYTVGVLRRLQGSLRKIRARHP